VKSPHTFSDAEDLLRAAGLALPEVTEDFPWGHRALKVKGKAFVFIALEHCTFSLSLKLPDSHAIALSMPFVAPTGYGLGRSGWVTASFTTPSQIPMHVLLSWLEESYQAIAPKRLSQLLPARGLELQASIADKPSAPRRRSLTSRGKAK
jgi:predicted DNA-binding protein (MmcQ/YjbR family)